MCFDVGESAGKAINANDARGAKDAISAESYPIACYLCAACAVCVETGRKKTAGRFPAVFWFLRRGANYSRRPMKMRMTYQSSVTKETNSAVAAPTYWSGVA